MRERLSSGGNSVDNSVPDPASPGVSYPSTHAPYWYLPAA